MNPKNHQPCIIIVEQVGESRRKKSYIGECAIEVYKNELEWERAQEARDLQICGELGGNSAQTFAELFRNHGMDVKPGDLADDGVGVGTCSSFDQKLKSGELKGVGLEVEEKYKDVGRDVDMGGKYQSEPRCDDRCVAEPEPEAEQEEPPIHKRNKKFR